MITAYTIQQEVPVLINEIREEVGLSPLRFNPVLTNIAKKKNQDILDSNNFSHKDSNKKFTWGSFDSKVYDIDYAGENLGMKFSTAKEVVDALMKSPTHKKNILNKNYKDVGYSIVPKDGKYMLAQIFGTSKNEKEGKKQYVYNPTANNILEMTTGSMQDWANYGYSPISQERYEELSKLFPRLINTIDTAKIDDDNNAKNVKDNSIESYPALKDVIDTNTKLSSVETSNSSRLDNIIKTGNANPIGKPNREFTNALYLEYHNRNATDNEFKRFNSMNIKDTANIIAGKKII